MNTNTIYLEGTVGELEYFNDKVNQENGDYYSQIVDLTDSLRKLKTLYAKALSQLASKGFDRDKPG